MSVILGYALGSLAEIYLLYDVEVGYMTPIICAIAHTNSIQLFLCESLSPLLDELTAQSPLQTEDNASSRFLFEFLSIQLQIIKRYIGCYDRTLSCHHHKMDSGKKVTIRSIIAY